MDQNPPDTPDPSEWPVGLQAVQIDPESAARLEHTERSIHQWSQKHMSLSLELRGLESTVLSLHQLKSQILEEALKKIGVSISNFDVAQVRSDGKVLLQPKGRPPAEGDPPPADRERAS